MKISSVLKSSEVIAIDTETTGLDVYDPAVRVIMVSMWDNKGRSFVRHHKEERLPAVQAVLESDVPKLFWNAKFDIGMLLKQGYKIRGPIIDVSLVARLLSTDERIYSLKHFSRKYLSDLYEEEIKLKKYVKANKVDIKRRGYSTIPDRILIPYAKKDAKNTLELFYLLAPNAYKGFDGIFELESAIQGISFAMEQQGVNIDIKKCIELKQEAEEEKAKIKARFVKLSGKKDFNPNSGPQLATLLYDGSRQATRFSAKTGLPSTAEIALLETGGDIATLALRWRKITKALSTYLIPTLRRTTRENIIHPTLNSVGALTGRYSSSNPNLQNIPRASDEPGIGRLRELFIAPKNYAFLFCDYSQIELRLAAHFSEEEHMIDSILNGRDLHGETTKRIFFVDETAPDWEVKRYVGKTINFSILYGAGASKVKDTVFKEGGLSMSIEEMTQAIINYQMQHPKIMELFDKVEILANNAGYITTWGGRRIAVPVDTTYVGVNYLIQGSAADVLKRAMLACSKLLERRKSKLILTVHDELIFKIHETEKALIPELVSVMQMPTQFRVPITCSPSIGRNWGQKKKLDLTKLR